MVVMLPIMLDKQSSLDLKKITGQRRSRSYFSEGWRSAPRKDEVIVHTGRMWTEPLVTQRWADSL